MECNAIKSKKMFLFLQELKLMFQNYSTAGITRQIGRVAKEPVKLMKLSQNCKKHFIAKRKETLIFSNPLITVCVSILLETAEVSF